MEQSRCIGIFWGCEERREEIGTGWSGDGTKWEIEELFFGNLEPEEDLRVDWQS